MYISIQKITSFKIKGEGELKLELFNNLINNTKENNVVKSFIKELSDIIEEKFLKNKLSNVPEEKRSLIQELQDENRLTIEYRDKMYIERNHILNDYAKKTTNKGTMYYIYNKSDKDYLLTICEKGKSHEIIKVSENDLPEGARIDTVLRKQNGSYIVDNEATKYVEEKMTEKFNKLVEEQTEKMSERRVEGHLYEIIESSKSDVWLMDIQVDRNNGKCFQEFFEETFENVKKGDVFQYINGKYVKYDEKKRT